MAGSGASASTGLAVAAASASATPPVLRTAGGAVDLESDSDEAALMPVGTPRETPGAPAASQRMETGGVETGSQVAGSGGGATCVKWFRCKWNCGHPMPEGDVFRKSPRAAPQCHPCARAIEAIDLAARKAGPLHKKAWEEIKKKDPGQAATKVGAARIPFKQNTAEHTSGLTARHTVIC